MKKYKEDIKTIFEVLGFLASYILIAGIDQPVIGAGVLCLIILVEAYAMYKSVKAKKDGELHTIDFPAENDEYQKITGIILGGVGIIGGTFWLSQVDETWYYGLLILLYSLLMFAGGLRFKRGGWLRVENGLLTMSRLDEELEVANIQRIRVREDCIAVQVRDKQEVKVNGYKLNQECINKVNQFLKDQLKGYAVEVEEELAV